MIAGTISLTILSMFFQPIQSTLPTQTGPLRNTFVVAAETVIDNASAVDLKAEQPVFDAQMQQLKAAKDNLSRMADDDREREAASAADDLIFSIAACHIQAKDGASTDRCQAQITQATNRAMEALHKHKSNGAWVDGPPVRTGGD